MNTCSAIDEGIRPPIDVPEEKVAAIPAAHQQHDRSSAVDESIRSLIDVSEDEDAALPAVHDDHPDDIELHRPLPSPYSSEFWKKSCYPHASLSAHDFLPLGFCVMALTTTIYSSWDCRYFKGASISFIGRNYGLWTVEDGLGKCQLWNALFFSYNLGMPLKAARFLSMFATLQGLGATTVITQSLQFHAFSWGIGALMLLLFLASLATTSIYNIWTTFYLFSYIILTLIVRFLLVHPVPRTISKSGTTLLVISLIGCSVYTILTLIVLTSDFCTCNNISSESLEDRDPGDPCSDYCSLGMAGGWMMGSSLLWLCAAIAVLKYGVQPELEEDESHKHYAHYPRLSILSRTCKAGTNLKQRAQKLRCRAYTDESFCENNAAEATENTLMTTQASSELLDDRRCVQKVCCDYRITPRSRREHWGFWCFRIGLGMLVFIYIFFLVVMIGSNRESTSAHRAPPTTKFFTAPEVCAFDATDPTKPFKTFPSREAALSESYEVAHCGSCGYCSNPQDIRTYVDTRETIAKTAKKCGPKAVLGKYEDLVACLQSNIGLSDDCTVCWADNMKTTASGCLFTCMTTLFMGYMSSNNVEGAGDRGWLNQCLFCDERKSGPAFVTCSGVARRRLGIASEIERNPNELCTRMDVDWLNVDWDSEFPETEERKNGFGYLDY